jgi:histidine ammonia-lyase
MSENKQKAAPCAVDSTPTSANQEDHVAMACHAARRLMEMNDNLGRILGVELLCGAQGIEYRAPLHTGPALARIIARLRQDVATLGTDRPLSPDVERGAQLIRAGAILEIAGPGLFPKLEDGA